jgi:hypothetical protein
MSNDFTRLARLKYQRKETTKTYSRYQKEVRIICLIHITLNTENNLKQKKLAVHLTFHCIDTA